MGFGDFITDLIPGPLDDWIVDSLFPDEPNGSGNGRSNIGDTIVKSITDRGAVYTQPGGPPTRMAAPTYADAGCAITMGLATRQVASCPPGYVAVDRDRDGYSDTCMLKEVARACGLWKPRPKPVLTASDRKALQRAQRVMGKVDTVVSTTNEIRGKAKYVKKTTSKK